MNSNGFSIAMATIYAINLIFGLGILINQIKIWFYYAYVRSVVSVTFFSPSLDAIVWLASFGIIVSEICLRLIKKRGKLYRLALMQFILFALSAATIAYEYGFGTVICVLMALIVTYSEFLYAETNPFKGRKHGVAMILGAAMCILITVEAGSIISWIINAFDHQQSFTGGARWIFPTLDLNISNVLYPLTSWLILTFLLCWTYPPIYNWLCSLWRHCSDRGSESEAMRSLLYSKIDRKFQLVIVLTGSALAAFVMYYPYIHLPPPYLAGIDGVHYFEYLTDMLHNGPLRALSSDRPLYLLILYGMASSGVNPEMVVRIMPAISAAALVTAVFIFVKTGANSLRLALASAIFTAFSFQITAGMIGYFLAQLFAVVEAFVFFTLLLEGIKRKSFFYMIMSALISIAIALTHPYTWLLVAATTAFYAVFSGIARRKISEALLPLIPLAITVGAMLQLYFVFGEGTFNNTSFLRTLSSMWQRFLLSINWSKVIFLESSLAKMAERWVGGAFGNPLIYLLGLLGLSSFINLRDNFNRLILSWVAIASIIIIAIIPNYEGLYYRIAFFIPFQIFAASGVMYIGRLIQNLCTLNGEGQRLCQRLIYGSFMVLTILLMFNYAIRTVDLVVMLLP